MSTIIFIKLSRVDEDIEHVATISHLGATSESDMCNSFCGRDPSSKKTQLRHFHTAGPTQSGPTVSIILSG